MRRRALLLAVALAAVGCGDTLVDPFLRDAQPYSIYGLVVADLFPQTQRVRVQRVRARIEPPTDPDEVDRQIDGQVRSLDPRSQVLLLWNRRVVSYDDGTAGVVFERAFQAVPDSRLTLTYEAPDGETVDAEVVFPPVPVGTPLPIEDPEGPLIQSVAWDARLGDTAELLVQGSRVGGGITGVAFTLGRDAYDETGRVVSVDIREAVAALRTVPDLVLEEDNSIPGFRIQMIVLGISDALPGPDVVPRDDLGRTFVAGGTVGRLTWTPPVDTRTL